MKIRFGLGAVMRDKKFTLYTQEVCVLREPRIRFILDVLWKRNQRLASAHTRVSFGGFS